MTMTTSRRTFLCCAAAAAAVPSVAVDCGSASVVVVGGWLCWCGVGGVGRWGVAVRDGGLRRNIRGRRPSHAVVDRGGG